jgi:hypothetical protein
LIEADRGGKILDADVHMKSFHRSPVGLKGSQRVFIMNAELAGQRLANSRVSLIESGA